MNLRNETLAPEVPATPVAAPPRLSSPLGRFGLTAIGLTLCFSLPLFDLVRFAAGSQLFSHIILIPLVSAYLGWQRRSTLPSRWMTDPIMAVIPLVTGLTALSAYLILVLTGAKLPREDALALTTSAYLLLIISAGGWFFGREMLRALAFPLSFLVFMVPMPVFLTDGIEVFLQHGSAEVLYALFQLAGTPVFRQELVFQLPGIIIQVAPECSGIHSTLALFITSILAGYFFLHSPGKRALLTLAVIPLALVRNGFRVFVVGELCVHISPDMINSYIHRQGGPIFFALSLVPFFLFLILLRRWDRRSVMSDQ